MDWEKYTPFGSQREGLPPASASGASVEEGDFTQQTDLLGRLAKALKIALTILALTLAACATPTSLMRSSPNLSGRLPGEHGALARCALHALEDYYATAWSYDLREFPREDRTQVIVRVFGTDTVLVADFRQAGVGQTDVMIWQNWGIIYDPKTVAWEGAKTCGQ